MQSREQVSPRQRPACTLGLSDGMEGRVGTAGGEDRRLPHMTDGGDTASVQLNAPAGSAK